jgi:hypothetical protein
MALDATTRPPPVPLQLSDDCSGDGPKRLQQTGEDDTSATRLTVSIYQPADVLSSAVLYAYRLDLNDVDH